MREDLVKSAESFLSSANVQSADKEKKIQFLKTKGLNDEEIEEAFRRMGNSTTVQTNTATNNTVSTAPKLPPRPTTITQIVYVPPEPIPRMTTRQLLSYAFIIVFSACGITVTLTAIIKKFMSKIFKSIADYQGNRYKQQTKLLKQIESTLSDFSISTMQDTSLQDEQKQLNNRLDHLGQLVQSLQSDRANTKHYKSLSSNIERLKNTLLQNPFSTNQFDYYSTSGSFGASFANRNQAVNDHNAAVQNIKSEIRTFKGLLLSRRNFPTISVGTPARVQQQQLPPSPMTTNALPGQPTNLDHQQPVYHPRIGRRSVRADLAYSTTENEEDNPTKTTVETVRDVALN